MLLEVLLRNVTLARFRRRIHRTEGATIRPAQGIALRKTIKKKTKPGATPQSFVSEEPLARWAEHYVDGTPPPRPSAWAVRMMDPSGAAKDIKSLTEIAQRFR